MSRWYEALLPLLLMIGAGTLSAAFWWRTPGEQVNVVEIKSRKRA